MSLTAELNQKAKAILIRELVPVDYTRFIPHPSTFILARHRSRARFLAGRNPPQKRPHLLQHNPQARKDLLTRLLKLNHHRAAEEAAIIPAIAAKSSKPQRAKQEDEML